MADIIEQFLTDLDVSLQTKGLYSGRLKQFEEWLSRFLDDPQTFGATQKSAKSGSEQKTLDSATEEDPEAFKAYLLQDGKSSNTASAYAKSAKRFVAWKTDRGEKATSRFLDDPKSGLGTELGRGDLAIENIVVDEHVQARVGIDKEVVTEYAESMQEGDKFPPIDVYYDGEKHWLADGFHRVESAKQVGFLTINAEVQQGSRRDAILHAVSSNAQHGLRRSNADKRKAVMILLEDSEWQGWSSSEIARRCKVTHPFVGKLRKEISSLVTVTSEDISGKDIPSDSERTEEIPSEKSPSGEIPNENQARTYRTKHGTTATMNTSKIGEVPTVEHEPTAETSPETTDSIFTTPADATPEASKPEHLDIYGQDVPEPSEAVAPNPDQLDFTQHEDEQYFGRDQNTADDDDEDYYGGGRKVSPDEIVDKGGYYNEEGDWVYESYTEAEKKALGDWIENSIREIWTLKEKFFGGDAAELLTEEQFRKCRSLSTFLQDLNLNYQEGQNERRKTTHK